MASLASVVVALSVGRLGYGSFILAIGIGAFAGLLSGLAHVKLKVPSFITTLAISGVLVIALRRNQILAMLMAVRGRLT